MQAFSCINLIIPVFTATLTFVPSGVGRKVTITKCCPENQVIDVSLMKCRDSGEVKWSPTYFTDTDNEHGDLKASEDVTGYETISNIPNCPGTGVHIIPLRDLEEHEIYAAKFRLLKSGRIVAKHANGHWVTVPDGSCVDGLQNFENSGSLYSGSEMDQALITCPLLEEEII